MTQPSVNTPKFEMGSDVVTKWLVVGALVVVAIVALLFARRLIAPIDGLLTQQACSTHGREELSRQSVEYERSNRFSLTNRTDGHCVFGPVVALDEDGDVVEPTSDEAANTDDPGVDGTVVEEEPAVDEAETLQVSLADIEPSRFYEWSKILFLVLQLGAASAAVRLVADPLLDRFVRPPVRDV